MPPAVAIAGIGAAASIGGAVLSSKAQKKAASKAADVAQDNTAANNALAREMYANNAARLDPYSANGLRASNALTEMLLGPTPAAPKPAAAPSALAPVAASTTPNALAGVAPQGPVGPAPKRPTVSGMPFEQREGLLADYHEARRNWVEAGNAQLEGRPAATVAPRPAAAPTTRRAAGAVTTTPSALSAWDQFRNSTNYKFREQQGLEAISQGAFANGWGRSGAADKALLEWNQNFAANELGRYQDLLAGQQNMGLTASSALAGVGQGMVGQVTANNNSAASAAANAALMNGQAKSNMYGGIASGIGQVAGALGSSYGSTPSIPPSYMLGGGTASYFAGQPYGY